MTNEEALNHYYDKGQRDFADGNFDPPLNIVTSIGATDYDYAIQKAYLAGYQNAKSQAE